MVIFHSYVSLPEGNMINLAISVMTWYDYWVYRMSSVQNPCWFMIGDYTILYYLLFNFIYIVFFNESTRGIPFLTNQYWMTPHSSFPRPSCGSSKTRCALRAFFAVWGPRAASESLQDAAEWIHQGDGGLALFNSFRFVSCRDQTWWNMINLDVLSHIILDQTMNRYMIYIWAI